MVQQGVDSTQIAAGHLEKSLTISPRGAEGLVPETVRRKMAQSLRDAPLLIESLSDASEMDEEPDRRKKRCKALTSGKVRTVDSTVVKRIT